MAVKKPRNRRQPVNNTTEKQGVVDTTEKQESNLISEELADASLPDTSAVTEPVIFGSHYAAVTVPMSTEEIVTLVDELDGDEGEDGSEVNGVATALDLIKQKAHPSWKNLVKYVEVMNPSRPSERSERINQQISLSRILGNLIIMEKEDVVAIDNIRCIVNLFRENNGANELFGFANSRRAVDFIPKANMSDSRRNAFLTLYTVLLRFAEEGNKVRFDWQVVAENIAIDGSGEDVVSRLCRAMNINRE